MNIPATHASPPPPLRTRGVQLTPTKFAIQHAASEAEVARQVADFLNHLQYCHVTALLPPQLGALSAATAVEIRNCAERVRMARASQQPLTATARYWLEEIGEVFDAATQRLDDLTRVS